MASIRAISPNLYTVEGVENTSKNSQHTKMHVFNSDMESLLRSVAEYTAERLRMEPPLDHSLSLEELRLATGETITAEGIGGQQALQLFADVLAPACMSVDNPRTLSFIPSAPTEASVIFDLIVGASSIYAGSWMEGSGAVFAENEALRWIADLAGFPENAGGVFVSGGTAGNLSALIAARWKWRHDTQGRNDRVRGMVVTSSGAHSSIAQAAQAMDADLFLIETATGKMTQEDIDRALPELGDDAARVFAVVATAGTTNAGLVDDLQAASSLADSLGVWFHVDGAYGAAALVDPSLKKLFAGIETADSFIVDPHKWLYSTLDSCALLYRDPRIAKAAHTQKASYLDVLQEDEDWNPSDYAHHLSRRARGLPLWFSLATYGTDAYRSAVSQTVSVAHQGAELIRTSEHLELVLEPELSVCLFRRIGWTAEDYRAWSEKHYEQQDFFLVPSSWNGETVLRYAIVNPKTTLRDLKAVFRSLK